MIIPLRFTIAALALAALNLSAATLYVSLESTNPVPPYATWATAATNIQDAVDAAVAGDTVLVTNGVYAVGSREALLFNREWEYWESRGLSRVVVTNSIRLASLNGPLVTTIMGDRILDEYGYPTAGIRCVYLGINAVLSGFTLTKGYAWSGGGIRGDPSAVVTNCILTGNSAVGSFQGGGGGGGGADGGRLYNCTLEANVVGGGFVGGGPWGLGGGAFRSKLYNCTLTGNSAGYGDGVYSCTLYNCRLDAHSKVGNPGKALPTVVARSSTLYNCTVTGNSGDGAEGSTLFNCTVTGNSGRGAAYGTVLHNCIVYYNSGGNYDEWTTMNYSCTTPLPTNGIGNITGPPLFMDMAAGDFRLREDSPCVDAGTNLVGLTMMATNLDTGEIYVAASYTHEATDILGNSRFIDGNGDGTAAWDIGAYEFDPASLQLVDIPDTGLLAVIRAALNKPTGDLTVGDMERLTVLDASRQARGPEAPLISSLEGLQAARNLTRLNLDGGGAGSPNLALSDFSPLAGLTNLTTLSLESNQLTSVSLPAGLSGLRELHLAGNQLASLILPEGLAGLRYLDVRDNPITYLAVPESMDLSQLALDGFPMDQVTVLMLRIGPAKVGTDGSIQLPLSGTSGLTVRVQRSTNLVEWVDWQTVTLDGTEKELLDGPVGGMPFRFYRVIPDTEHPGE